MYNTRGLSLKNKPHLSKWETLIILIQRDQTYSDNPYDILIATHSILFVSIILILINKGDLKTVFVVVQSCKNYLFIFVSYSI